MRQRVVTLVRLRNNATSVPPVSVIVEKRNGLTSIFSGIAIVGLFLQGVGGTGTYSAYAASGLPGGLSLDTSTGEITGSLSQGHYTFSATATDSQGTTSDATSFSLDVISELGFEQSEPPEIEGFVQSYDYQYNVGGAIGTVTYAVTTGSLPPGVSLSSSGHLTGTPTTILTTRYSGTITATDSGTGGTLDIPFSLLVHEVYSHHSSPGIWHLVVGIPLTVDNSFANGVPPYTYTQTGSIPAGLQITFSANTNECTLLATQAFASTLVNQFSSTDSFGVTTIMGGFYLDAVQPIPSADAGNAISQGTDGALYVAAGGGGGGSSTQFKDGAGNLGSAGPASVKIYSSDGTVDVSGSADSAGNIEFDLSATNSAGSGGGGGSPFVSAGAYGTRPAAGTLGRLFFSTDLPVVSYDNGATWQEFWHSWNVPDFVTAVASTNPTTWYRLNESSGTTIHDTGSAGLNATLTSGYTLGQTILLPNEKTKFGGSPAAAANLTLTGNPTGTSTPVGDFSAAAVVWLTTGSGGSFWSFFDASAPSSYFFLLELVNNVFKMQVMGATQAAAFDPYVANGSLALLGVTHDATAHTSEFFLNGRNLGKQTSTTEYNLTMATPTLKVANDRGGTGFTGLLADCIFWYGRKNTEAEWIEFAQALGIFAL